MPLPVSAQTVESWQDALDRMGETEDVDDGSLELVYDELSELYANKLDINSCTRAQLEKLPFLSAQQVSDIIEYRERTGRLETPLELYLIASLDRKAINLLRQFITFSPPLPGDSIPSLRSVFRYGHNTLLADFKVPLYKRKGDENGYLGYQYKHWLRYSFNYGQRVRFGLTASHDAGEPFFAGRYKQGYDFYSFYLMLNDIKRLKALALGRYRLRFGMGLILNNGSGFGKLATLSNLMSQTHILAHTSRSESNCLQGAAGTVTLAEGLDVTGFVSYRKIDATLNKDSTVRTILTSGYHRTVSEMERRHNTAETLAGGNINYFNNGFHVGLTGYYTSFDRPLKMDNGQKYRRWYPDGSSFYNLSIDYGFLSNRLTIAGETAMDKNKYVATINTVNYQLSSRLTLSALQRYFPYQYNAIYAQTFSEGGRANDESGVFVGGKIIPWANALVSFYSDISYFAWSKYMALQSSHRWDNFLQLDVNSGDWNFFVRYRYKMKELDNDGHTGLVKRHEHRGSAALTFANDCLSLRTQADYALTNDEGANSRGYMISESGVWQVKWLKVRGSLGYFHTDDYSSRVYGMEPGLLYTFTFPLFYGEGMRCALSLRAELNDSLLFIVKGGMTHYFDRSTISSGLEEIDGSSMTDIEMQLRYKF